MKQAAVFHGRERCEASGFTLVEILLAITLLALVVSMLLGTMRTMASGHSHLGRRQEIWEMGRMGMTRLAADLIAVTPLPPLPGGEPTGEASPALQGRSEGGTLQKETHLRLVTRPPGRDPRPEAAWPREVFYHVAAADAPYEGPFVVLRGERVPMSADAPAPETDDPVLWEGVQTLSFRFFDAAGRAHDHWPPRNADASVLPRALEVDLLLTLDGQQERFRTRIAVPLAGEAESRS